MVMTLIGISNRGLLLIAILVGILWGCIFAERAIVAQALLETEQVRQGDRAAPVKHRRNEHPAPASRMLARPLLEARLQAG